MKWKGVGIILMLVGIVIVVAQKIFNVPMDLAGPTFFIVGLLMVGGL